MCVHIYSTQTYVVECWRVSILSIVSQSAQGRRGKGMALNSVFVVDQLINSAAKKKVTGRERVEYISVMAEPSSASLFSSFSSFVVVVAVVVRSFVRRRRR